MEGRALVSSTLASLVSRGFNPDQRSRSPGGRIVEDKELRTSNIFLHNQETRRFGEIAVQKDFHVFWLFCFAKRSRSAAGVFG